MKQLPSQSIDLVLADPPYGITKNLWDEIIPISLMWHQLERVCKGAIVLTSAQPFSSKLVMSNLVNFAYEWVWIKSQITGVLNAKKMPVRKHEQILVFGNLVTYNPQNLRLKKSIRHSGGSENYGKTVAGDYVQEFTNWPRDVLNFQSPTANRHPTEKPLDLMQYLVKTYSNVGETVLDFCMGSGTTGVACKLTDRRFIGYELNKEYFKVARMRL